VALGLLLLALTIVSGYSGINAVVKAELFPVEIRALGIGLPHALTVAVFGGTAEYIALWCKGAGHETYFYYYIVGCIGISLLLFLTMAETRPGARLPAAEK
jgi:MHS family alpha-ketoglutarate permease-like MFS transporter